MAKAAAAQPSRAKRTGLSLGATVGIAIGVALIVILGAAAAWIIVRRRRRAYSDKRRLEGEKDVEGDTPNDEIEKRLQASRPQEFAAGEEVWVGHKKIDSGALAKEMLAGELAEIGDGEKRRSELVGSEVYDIQKGRPMSELYAASYAHEMPTLQDQAVEIGDGKGFVAELDGTPTVALATKTADKEQTIQVDEAEVKPLNVVKE